jgi:hypothetical protein
MYFFQVEDYKKALSYFEQINEFKSKLDESQNALTINKELNAYSSDLDSYLLACNSILCLNTDANLANNHPKIIDPYSNQVVKKVAFVENAIKNEFKVLKF